jgi:hypothetical protein
LINVGNKARNEVVPSLQLHIDIAPGRVHPVSAANETVVEKDSRNCNGERRCDDDGHFTQYPGWWSDGV